MRRLGIAYLIALHVLCGWLALRAQIPMSVRNKVVEWGLVPIGDRPIVLGDSIIRAMPAPPGVNLAIDALTTSKLLAFMQRYRAHEVYLMIGANDLLQGQRPQFAEVARNLRDSNVIWSGVTFTRAVDPKVTAAANVEIQALCKALPNCRYVDTSSLDGDDFVPDGLHLSVSGHEKFVRLIRQTELASTATTSVH